MKNKILLGMCGAAAIALASTANATVVDELRYSTDGSTWTTVTDPSGTGFINTVISGGGFTLSVNTTAFSVGTASHPDIDLDLAGTTSAIGTLIVEYSVLNFTPPSTGSYILHAGGNLSGVTATEYAFLGDNVLYAGTGFPVPPGSVSGGGVIGPLNGLGDITHAAFPSQANPYSATLVTVITSRTTGTTLISDDSRLSVPDGGNTLMMLGSALSVVGLGVFRRKIAKKA